MKIDGPAFTIAPTGNCPIGCKHCGKRSSPEMTTALPDEIVIRSLSEATACGCDFVNFTGGEPFAVGQKRLCAYVHHASDQGLATRISTSGYWSSSDKAAISWLEPLKTAGLKELALSTSDSHRETIPLSRLIIASRLASSMDILVFISIALTKSSRTTALSLQREFEDAGCTTPYILESPILQTGRAEDWLPPADLILQPSEVLEGPCRSAGRHPMLHPSGTITSCASILSQDVPQFSFGSIFETSLDKSVNAMNRNKLIRWLREKGPLNLAESVAHEVGLSRPTGFVNLCDICRTLFCGPNDHSSVRRVLSDSN